MLEVPDEIFYSGFLYFSDASKLAHLFFALNHYALNEGCGFDNKVLVADVAEVTMLLWFLAKNTELTHLRLSHLFAYDSEAG